MIALTLNMSAVIVVICCYFLTIVYVLLITLPLPNANFCCALLWANVLCIGIPASFVWMYLLFYQKWPHTNILLVWLIPTCLMGNMAMLLQCACQKHLLYIFAAVLTIQNNVLLCVPLLAYAACKCKNLRSERYDSNPEDEDLDWQRL